MNENLLKLIANSNPATSLLSKKGNFVVDETIGVSLLFAGIFSKKPGKYTIIASNLFSAQKIVGLLSSLIGSDNVLLFPYDDILRCELLSASKEFLAQRLFVLNEIRKKDSFILVTHASALLTPLPSKNEFEDSIVSLKVGDIIDREKLQITLTQSGYVRTNKIDQGLEYAIRGDIFDVFSINYDKPIRIEFFDNEVESIHFFDIANQTSSESLDSATLLPGNDLLINEDELNEFKVNVYKQLEKDVDLLGDLLGSDLTSNVSNDIDKISNRIYSPRTYKYFRYIKHNVCSVMDYFESDISFITNEKQFNSTIEFLIKESRDYLNELFNHGKLLSHLELYLDEQRVLKNIKHLLYGNNFKQDLDDIVFNTHPLIVSKTNISELKMVLESYLNSNEKVIISVSNKQQYELVVSNLKDLKYKFENLKELELPRGKIGITLFSLEEGFELPDYKICYISSKELFGYHVKSSRYISRFKEATIIKNYEDLKPGDYVVHEYYGIGKFVDVKTIEIDGVHRDYLYIEYAGENILYVPLNQFRLVRKYSGREGAAPKLSNLNTGGWEKTKAQIKERVNLLADRLYKLYSERARTEGFSFQKDDELQASFEREFEYELTKDQIKSLDEIKKDMESNIAMDRLLCGDVGFGKTEVAFRAIFKCISSGKQAALLCPTTLLARQHYENAVERFKNFGVNIAVISRLVPEKKQKEYIRDIKDGKIHLVIGTHRLLSKDFQFKDLGLLVIDEEQRFGVEQKELIKELKNNIDVLSLSATPIPRTLQLSLIGVRPVSQINTPPNERSTIQTYVAPYKEEIIKELIERELSRNGQVFYVFNNVSSITTRAMKIKRLVPYANIGVVHGKMLKDDIEDVMMKFYSGEINVLVATSIIENGIDVPNANLMIVEDADHFGLSQLYQIKGRVGRGDRIAYAYLFYKEQKMLTSIAQKRLKAIQDFAELGSGYKISQRDLMIRGAGDILGPEQAGFIDSVGLDLYLKMLNEVMEERKTGKPVVPPKPVKLFQLDAYIPGDYASKEDKIQLYQMIENAKNPAELKDVKKQMRDIFGRLPEEVNLLFKKREIDINLENKCFDNVSEYEDYILLALSKSYSSYNGIGSLLFESLSPVLDKIQVSYVQKMLKIKVFKKDNWLLTLDTVTHVICNLYSDFSKRNDKL
ncbi:MAG: transcription-repair coupling factor [Bacilli bacterium]|nr:transcription-repair coupling factor [Bacilli bacterium]